MFSEAVRLKRRSTVNSFCEESKSTTVLISRPILILNPLRKLVAKANGRYILIFVPVATLTRTLKTPVLRTFKFLEQPDGSIAMQSVKVPPVSTHICQDIEIIGNSLGTN